MTKITSNTTTTHTATPSARVEATKPATKPQTDVAPAKKECAPESTPKDSWETGKDEKSDGFFSKLGQKIDQTIDDAKSTVNNAGETVKKAASDAVNDGIDNVQKNVNNAVDNFQKNVDNVQKNVNDTVDALQTLDAKTVKDIIIQDVKSTGQSVVDTVKDVAEVASQAVEKHQEIKKAQHEAVSRAIEIAFEKAPEILEAAKNATESFVKSTEEVIEKYALPAVEEAYKEISSNTEAFKEKIEFYAQNPHELARAAFHLEGEVKDLGTKLVGELAIVASDVIAKHQDVLRTTLDAITSIETPTPQGVIFNEIKKHIPEDTLLYSAVHLASRGVQGLIQDQLQSMAKQIGNQAINAAIQISKNPQGFRDAIDLTTQVQNLKPGQEFKAGVDFEADIHIEVGGNIEGNVGLKAKRDKDNPNEIVITLSAEAAVAAGVGTSIQGQGAKGDLGLKGAGSVELKFDSNDPEQMKDMKALLQSYGRGTPSPLATTVLGKYVQNIEIEASSTFKTDFKFVDLGADAKLKASMDPKTGEVTMTASLGVDASVKMNDFYMQIPSALVPPSDATANTDPLAKQVMDAILGKNNVGIDAGAKLSLEVGVVFEPGKGTSIEDVQSIYLEVKGEAHLNERSAEGKFRAEIHNPAELAKLLNTDVKDLIRDFKNQTLTLDDIAQRVATRGASLDRFIKIDCGVDTKKSDGFKVDTSIINFEARTFTPTSSYELIKYPPENTATPLLQNDTAAAELRLLDRAIRA